MANQLAALPWVVDTLSADPITEGKVLIDHIVYVDWADPSHVAEVQDSDGNLIAVLSGNGLQSSDHTVNWVKGIIVPIVRQDGLTPNMPSGKLIFYLR